ncbi:hypothetical protein ABZ570_04460 [Micromonospora sp. NPDC007271]|uniref:hypothetical protein n=1 Tax=Micromonospora sp. NPDC007271 TaxID=3154587 RepID=UPI00340DD689
MIVTSILLILVAVVLLVVGLAEGSSPLLITSIAASLLAAVALVAGARQAAANRATAGRTTGPRLRTAPTGDPYGSRPGGPEIPVQRISSTVDAGGPGWRQPPGSPVTDPSEPSGTDPYAPPGQREPFEADAVVAAPTPTSPAAGGPYAPEPPAQQVSPGDLARLARLDDPVRVVDGHPRFHLPHCPHLAGREDEALPVAEAVGLGFTPCARCGPATVLLTDAQSG